MLAVAMFGVGLGAVLMAWEGLTIGASNKALRDGALGALIGGVAGAIGGAIAEALFDAVLGDGGTDAEDRLQVARVVAWAAFGGIIGLGLGIKGGSRKVVNGVLGGLCGGAVGGVAFAVLSGPDSGFTTRALGFAATGIGIGLGIGIVERLRREAWLVISTGPMAGKEFILYRPVTTIGSSPKSDITLPKDAAVGPVHLALRRGDGHTITATSPSGYAVVVNGRSVGSIRLRHGDVVMVGATGLSFQERLQPSA